MKNHLFILIPLMFFSLHAISQINARMAGVYMENNYTPVTLTIDTGTKNIDHMPTVCYPIHVAEITLDTIYDSAYYYSGACSGTTFYLYGAGTFSKTYDTIYIPEIYAYFSYTNQRDNAQGPLLLVRNVTGVNTFNSGKVEIKLWPNPTNKILNFIVASPSQETTIKVINLLGLPVYETKLNASDYNKKLFINVESLPAGIYMLQVFDGQYWSGSKFLKD